MPRVLEIRIGPGADALDRFEAAWNRVLEGRRTAPLHVLTLEDLPRVLRTLSPARFELLEALRSSRAVSIYQLAKRLRRDYKNVHGDVSQLAELGLIERDGDGLISVPWDVLRAEFAL